jgi:hypothetical protein
MCARGTATLWNRMEGVYGWFPCMASAKVMVQVRLYGLWLVPHCLMFCGKKVSDARLLALCPANITNLSGMPLLMTLISFSPLLQLRSITTCGAIIPEKTAWWLVSFRWYGLSWQYASSQDSPGELYVNDLHNDRKLLQRLEPSQAYKTLGVFMAPDGNCTAQFNKLLTLATSWSDAMRTGTIRWDKAWLAVSSTIMRSLAYPLPALSLSQGQWEAIMAPILKYCLPAMGICRNFPWALVFSSPTYFGLGFQHLHTMQEIAHIKDIIWHTYAGTLTGILCRTSLELFLIEVGVGTDLLDIPCEVLPLATQSLIQDMVIFSQTHKLDLRHDISMLPSCEDDQLIMRALLP